MMERLMERMMERMMEMLRDWLFIINLGWEVGPNKYDGFWEAKYIKVLAESKMFWSIFFFFNAAI